MTADMIEVRKARTTGVLSILIAVTALMNLTCGIIYSEQGGVDGSGIWSGTGLAVCAAVGLMTWSKRRRITMVCFVVLDVLWFLVCVVGMISALLLWLIHHIIRGVLEENCHKTEAGICHCMGEGDVLVKIDNCDKSRMIERCLLGILVLNSLGAALLLAGSIVGCRTLTCCSNRTVRRTNSVVEVRSGMGKQPVSEMPAHDDTINVEKL